MAAAGGLQRGPQLLGATVPTHPSDGGEDVRKVLGDQPVETFGRGQSASHRSPFVSCGGTRGVGRYAPSSVRARARSSYCWCQFVPVSATTNCSTPASRYVARAAAACSGLPPTATFRVCSRGSP